MSRLLLKVSDRLYIGVFPASNMLTNLEQVHESAVVDLLLDTDPKLPAVWARALGSWFV